MPRGELRIVDKSPRNWTWIAFNVLEHLIELDKEGKLVPGLATGWRWLDDHTLEVTLRQGVAFHNGEVFDAEIVKLNWDENIRSRQPHAVEYLTFKPGSRLEIVDRYTVRFLFPNRTGRPWPDSPSAHGQPPVLSRTRLGGEAVVNDRRAGPWGTGPYQLVEGFSLPGKRSDRVVLEANPDYWDRTRMPRQTDSL